MRVNTIICIIQKLIIDYSDDEDDKVTIVCKAVLQWLEAPLPHLGRGFSNPIFLFSLTTQHHSVTTLLQIITTCSMKRKKQINTIYNDFCLSHIGTCEVFGSTSSLVQVTRKNWSQNHGFWIKNKYVMIYGGYVTVCFWCKLLGIMIAFLSYHNRYQLWSLIIKNLRDSDCHLLCTQDSRLRRSCL